MTDINSFYNFSLAVVGRDAQLALNDTRTELTTRTRRSARWIGKFRFSANRRTTNLFVQSLRSRYGSEVADGLVRSFGLERSAQFGKPLRARQVRQVVDQARDMTAVIPFAEQQVNPPRRWKLIPELTFELQRACERGFVNQFVLARDPACPYPHRQSRFAAMLRQFNDLMADLHQRFPDLRNVRPPNLSQNAVDARVPHFSAMYDSETETMEFASVAAGNGRIRSQQARALLIDAPKTGGFFGTILHEYSHHLASAENSNQLGWLTGLGVMLQENGFISDASRLDSTSDLHPSFGELVGNKTLRMGLGTYAGTNAAEFVAEVLAWRMSPGYGETDEIPKMPPYLENWVHEYFPFLRPDS